MFEDTLHPPELHGTPDQIPLIKEYEWIKLLPADKKIYLALWQGQVKFDLPFGFDHYIVSFHLEQVNLEWLQQQVIKVKAPIIVLFDGNFYDYTMPGVNFVSYCYWHEQLRKIINWYKIQNKPESKYKFSAVCNRVTQSKLWVTSKLLECAREQSQLIVSDWVEEKNVHNWSQTGNAKLDNLTQIFQTKYLNSTLKIDAFDNKFDNNQRYTSNPWQPILAYTSVHFSNESFHYSYYNDGQKQFTYPGPFLTEKTMKCLISGCTLIPVGQFETYQSLRKFGLNFDYGFDTSWDNDPGDISRLSSIVDLIDVLNKFSVGELDSQHKEVNMYNQNFIASGKFWNAVNRYNRQSVEKIFELLRG